MPTQRYYPNNASQIDRQLWDMVYDGRDRAEALEKDLRGLVKQIPTTAAIQKQLQSTGKEPLNATGLIGRLMTNQYAYVPKFTAVPSVKDPSASVGDGTLVSVTSNPTGASGGILYRFNEPLDLGAFIAQQAVGTTLSGTHAQRLANYPAGNYEPGTLFYETDTHTVYIDVLVANVPTWVILFSNTIEDLHANRVSAGNVNYAGNAITRTSGDFFFANMVGNQIAIGYILYTVVSYIDPSNITISVVLGAGATSFIYSKYPATNYAKGTLYWETDRTWFYLNVDSVGTVTTSGTGTTVTRNTGDFFDPYWAGASIVINGVTYLVDHVVGTAVLELTTAAPIIGPVAYTVSGGKWKWVAGEFIEALANIPAGLGLNDTGALFADTTLLHLYQWSGAAWGFAPGDPGSRYLVGVVAGVAPNGGVWGLCDGSTYSVSNGTGGTANVTTPNLTNGDFIRAGNSAHQAASQPTWDGAAKVEPETSLFQFPSNTDDEASHTHGIGTGTVEAFTTNPAVVSAASSTGPGSAHNHAITNTNAPQLPHDHTLTNANAKLNPPSDGAGGLPANIGLSWYIRR